MIHAVPKACPCGCGRLTLEQLGEVGDCLCVIGCLSRECTRIPGVGRGETPILALERAVADWNREDYAKPEGTHDR